MINKYIKGGEVRRQKELLKNVLAFLKRAVKKVLASLEMCWHFLKGCYNF